MSKQNFHKFQVNRTEFEVPERYAELTFVGRSAFGLIWCVESLIE